jgi:hypothetical protein
MVLCLLVLFVVDAYKLAMKTELKIFNPPDDGSSPEEQR